MLELAEKEIKTVMVTQSIHSKNQLEIWKIFQKTQTKLLKQKTTMSEMKNMPNEINDILNITK